MRVTLDEVSLARLAVGSGEGALSTPKGAPRDQQSYDEPTIHITEWPQKGDSLRIIFLVCWPKAIFLVLDEDRRQR